MIMRRLFMICLVTLAGCSTEPALDVDPNASPYPPTDLSFVASAAFHRVPDAEYTVEQGRLTSFSAAGELIERAHGIIGEEPGGATKVFSRGGDSVRYEAWDGVAFGYTARFNDVVLESAYPVMSAFVDAERRIWVAVLAKSREGVRRHGYEVYGTDGEQLFTIEIPPGEAIYDAHGNRAVFAKNSTRDSVDMVVRLFGSEGDLIW